VSSRGVPAGRRDLLLGAVTIGGGAAIAWLASQIRGMPGQPFSPGFVPGIVGCLAMLVGAVLILRAATGHAPPIEEEMQEDGAGPPLPLAATWLVAGILAIAFLLEAIGFLPLMVVWLAGFQALLGVRLLPALLLSVGMSFAVDQAFTRLLGVPLPPGDWLIDLGWV